MKIVVAVRCYNESKNIDRFMRGYDFADEIVVSDGGSTDDSVSILQKYPKVRLFHFSEQETINGETWNLDAPHMNFVLDKAKELDPDLLIFDDMDCVPNENLRRDARDMLKFTIHPQINVFRLYLWGDEKYFPYMNRHFDYRYTSLWAWKPRELDIRADMSVRHGTLLGLQPEVYNIVQPYCLLHKSWNPETVEKKIDRYNKLGLPMEHPLSFAGEPAELPNWAHE